MKGVHMMLKLVFWDFPPRSQQIDDHYHLKKVADHVDADDPVGTAHASKGVRLHVSPHLEVVDQH